MAILSSLAPLRAHAFRSVLYPTPPAGRGYADKRRGHKGQRAWFCTIAAVNWIGNSLNPIEAGFVKTSKKRGGV